MGFVQCKGSIYPASVRQHTYAHRTNPGSDRDRVDLGAVALPSGRASPCTLLPLPSGYVTMIPFLTVGLLLRAVSGLSQSRAVVNSGQTCGRQHYLR